jgi:hypothetical protein
MKWKDELEYGIVTTFMFIGAIAKVGDVIGSMAEVDDRKYINTESRDGEGRR